MYYEKYWEIWLDREKAHIVRWDNNEENLETIFF